MSTTLSHVERGRKGASKRWGPPRRIHIGDLSPEQRKVVLAFIEAQRKAQPHAA